jgi:hypothetical protein
MGTICIESSLLFGCIYFLVLFSFTGYLLYILKPSMKVRDLCLASSEWSSLSLENKEPVTKMLHASFGLAFFNAAKYMSNEKEIQNLTGIDANEFSNILKDNLKNSIESVKVLYSKK